MKPANSPQPQFKQASKGITFSALEKALIRRDAQKECTGKHWPKPEK